MLWTSQQSRSSDATTCFDMAVLNLCVCCNCCMTVAECVQVTCQKISIPVNQSVLLRNLADMIVALFYHYWLVVQTVFVVFTVCYS